MKVNETRLLRIRAGSTIPCPWVGAQAGWGQLPKWAGGVSQ